MTQWDDGTRLQFISIRFLFWFIFEIFWVDYPETKVYAFCTLMLEALVTTNELYYVEMLNMFRVMTVYPDKTTIFLNGVIVSSNNEI